MDEPIIYDRWLSHPFVKKPAESLSDLLDNALSLDDKDEFLRLLNDPDFEPMQEYHQDQILGFLRVYNLESILRENAPQIAMAVINGETKDVFVNPKLEFKDGWTPLHLACAIPSPKLLKCLIERGDPLDVPCDYYAPLKLKHATPLDLILEVIDAGYESGYYTPKRPWTLCSSIFELFHYVCEWQKHCLEVIRLLVQNTENKERVRTTFLDYAKEGTFVKVAALFLAVPELFLSTSLEGGSMSSIDALHLYLKSLDKMTDIEQGLSLLLDVFDLVGHKLVAYVRHNDPKVWALSFHLQKYKIGFFIREVAHKKLGISSRDDYLLSFFKPVREAAFEPPYSRNKPGDPIRVENWWCLLHFPILKKDIIDIDYVNRMFPSLEPHEADDLSKAIEDKLSIMPNICTLFEGTTRTPNKGGERRLSSFPRPRSIELPTAQSFCTAAANVNRRLDFKLTPRKGWESRVMNPTKLESFVSAVRLSRFPMIAKRLIK